MYAVIETGGKQFRVSPGDNIVVDRMVGEVGSPVEFTRVLAISKGENELLAGAAAAGVTVRGTIAAHGRGDKILVFKFKRKKQYKRTIGHRQDQTTVTVNEILV